MTWEKEVLNFDAIFVYDGTGVRFITGAGWLILRIAENGNDYFQDGAFRSWAATGTYSNGTIKLEVIGRFCICRLYMFEKYQESLRRLSKLLDIVHFMVLRKNLQLANFERRITKIVDRAFHGCWSLKDTGKLLPSSSTDTDATDQEERGLKVIGNLAFSWMQIITNRSMYSFFGNFLFNGGFESFCNTMESIDINGNNNLCLGNFDWLSTIQQRQRIYIHETFGQNVFLVREKTYVGLEEESSTFNSRERDKMLEVKDAFSEHVESIRRLVDWCLTVGGILGNKF